MLVRELIEKLLSCDQEARVMVGTYERYSRRDIDFAEEYLLRDHSKRVEIIGGGKYDPNDT